jgi:signal transduction histidine kinase
MIIVKNMTSLINYEKAILENHFYEMLTATVSHDMRTPLNAIISLLGTIEYFITNQRGIK